MRIENKDSIFRIVGNVVILGIVVALMIVGLAVYTPVQDELQYNKLTYVDAEYDAIVPSPIESQLVELAKDENIKSIASFQETKVSIGSGWGAKKVSIMFFEESTPYYISTFNENSLIKGQLDLNEGVVIDKTAQELLKVDLGDKIEYILGGREFESVVTGIVAPCKLSLYNSGLVLARWNENYENALNAPFHPTVAFVDLIDPENVGSISNFVGYGLVGSYYEYLIDLAKEQGHRYSELKTMISEAYEATDKTVDQESFACEYLLELTRNKDFTAEEWKTLRESDYSESIAKLENSAGRATPTFRLELYDEFGKNTIEKLTDQTNSSFAIFVIIEIAVLFGGYLGLIAINKKATAEQLRIANNISAIHKRFYFVSAIAILVAVLLGVAIGNIMNIGVHIFTGNIAFMYTVTLIPLAMLVLLPLLFLMLYRKELNPTNFNAKKVVDRKEPVENCGDVKSSDVVAKKRIYLNDFVRMPLPLYLVQIAVVILFAVLFSSMLMSNINQISFHARADYSSVVYSEADIGVGSSYVSLSGAKYRANVELIDCNAELLMIRPDGNYDLSPLKYDNKGEQVDKYLQKGECVVSSNLLKELGLKVGDKINIKVSSTQNELNTVVAEFPNSYGIDPEMSADGIIVIGYNEAFADVNNYASFIDEDKMFVNVRIYSKAKLVSSAEWFAAGIAVGYVVVYVLLAFLTEYLFEKNKVDTYGYIYRLGMSKGNVRLLILKELLLKYAPITLLIGLINFIALIYSAGINSIVILLLNALAVLIAVAVNWIVYNRRSF